MTDWVPVQIPIPESRVTEFFDMFGRWMQGASQAGEERTASTPEISLSSWRDGLVDQRRRDAQYVYEHMSPAARAILDYWLDHPNTPITGEDLSTALGFAGPHVISGTLKSIGHHSKVVHRELPQRYEAAPGGGKYWIEPDVAELFSAARSARSDHPENNGAANQRHDWRAVEDLRPYLEPILADLGRMPTQRELMHRGRSDISSAVRRFGGASAVARALGIPQAGTGSWKSIEDLRPHLDPIVAELGRLPAQADLRERGRQDLVGAIHKYGGHRRVAEVLGYPYPELPGWSSVEDLRSELDPIVAEIGVMPDRRELASRDRLDLASAIAKFGGFSSVAEALGYEH
jgi:hypothetical protein